MSSEVTTLYLVRHAQSGRNTDGVVEGHSQVDLTPLGIEQAYVAKEKLRGVAFDGGASSDLRRAIHTGEIILEDHEPPIILELYPSLRERHYGVAEGDTEEFLKMAMEGRRSLIEAALTEEERRDVQAVEGMESDNELLTRALSTLRTLVVEHPGETLLIVLHGNLIRTLLTYFNFGNYQELRTGSVKNCAIVKMTSDGEQFSIEQTDGVEKKADYSDDALLAFMRFHSHIV